MKPIVLSALARDVGIGDLYNYHNDIILKSKDFNDSITFTSQYWILCFPLEHITFAYSFANLVFYCLSISGKTDI